MMLSWMNKKEVPEQKSTRFNTMALFSPLHKILENFKNKYDLLNEERYHFGENSITAKKFAIYFTLNQRFQDLINQFNEHKYKDEHEVFKYAFELIDNFYKAIMFVLYDREKFKILMYVRNPNKYRASMALHAALIGGGAILFFSSSGLSSFAGGMATSFGLPSLGCQYFPHSMRILLFMRNQIDQLRLQMKEQCKNIIPGPTYYVILGVKEDETSERIRKAYKRLALKYHPDKPGGNNEIFAKIDAAYKVLSTPEDRQAYDYQLHLLKSTMDQEWECSQFEPPQEKRLMIGWR